MVAAVAPAWRMSSDEFVARDAEFDRIAALPRRTHIPVDMVRLEAYLRAPHSDGSAHLRPRQAELLWELYEQRGGVGPLPTGSGKTMPAFLAASLPHPQDPRRFWVERPVLVVDGELATKATTTDLPRIQQHWRTHPNLKVITYQLLQGPRQSKLLWSMMPDLLVFDEVQGLRNRKSARTQRVEHFIEDYPGTIVLALSASLFKRRLKDAAHIFWYALRTRSPLPRPGSAALEDWGKAIDERGEDAIYSQPGALWAFCNPGETPIQGVRRRIMETPGVVGDFVSSCDSALNIFGVAPETIPPEIIRAFAEMRRTNTTPSGDELTDSMNIWRRVREMAYGFFYRWVWPDGVADIEWLFARAAWRRFVRYVLKHNRRGIDSEARVRAAVDQGLYGLPGQGPDEGPGSRGKEKLDEWRRVRGRWHPHPPRETVWISTYVAQACADWLTEERPKDQQHRGRLCWVEHTALGEMIAKLAGVPYFGAGNDGLERYKGPCVVSIWANSRGRNPQDRYSENLYACAPPGGDTWEQSLSRTHRSGQPEDEVTAHVFLHCLELWEAFAQARRDAVYQQQIQGQPQKLNIATLALLTEQQVSGRLTNSSDPLWSTSVDNE